MNVEPSRERMRRLAIVAALTATIAVAQTPTDSAPASRPDAAEAESLVSVLVDDPIPSDRFAALNALRKIGPERRVAVKPLLRSLVRDDVVRAHEVHDALLLLDPDLAVA